MSDLKNLLERYKASVLKKDLELFTSIFDEEVKVYDMWNKWSYKGLNSWKEMATGWFNGLGKETCLVEFKDTNSIESGDFGYLTSFATFSAVSSGGKKLKSLQNRLTWVARKTDNGWKVIHEHTSSPVDCNTMEVFLTPDKGN